MFQAEVNPVTSQCGVAAALGAAVPAEPLRSMSIRGPAALQAPVVSARRWFFIYRTIRIPLLTPLRHVVRSPRVVRSQR